MSATATISATNTPPNTRSRLLFPERWPPFVLATLFISIALTVAYHETFPAPFIFDDLPGVVRNPAIRQLWPLGAVLLPGQTGGAGALGWPIVNLSLALNHAAGGLDVRGYHIVNLLIHLAASVLLFAVLHRTFAQPPLRARYGAAAFPLAFGAALLWSLHPLQTESVTCVIQRAELLTGLFCLLTLYAFIRMAHGQTLDEDPSSQAKPQTTDHGPRTTDDRPRTFPSHGRMLGAGGPWSVVRSLGLSKSLTRLQQASAFKDFAGRAGVWLAVCVLACLAGMACREVMVTAPVLVLLYDRTFVAGTFREAWRRRRGLHLALAATCGLAVFLIARGAGRGVATGFGSGVGPWDQVLTQCRAVVLYLKLAAWPDPLVLDYGTTVVRHLGDVWPHAALLVSLAVATGIALVCRPVLGFAGIWFFITLVPGVSLVSLTAQPIAEHRMYLPLAALMVLVVVGLQAAIGRRVLFGAVALAVVAGGATLRRNADYRSALVIWGDTVAKAPANARARFNLANALSAAGRSGEAIAHYEAALRLEPGHGAVHFNLAGTLLQLGRAREAVEHYEAALRIGPDAVDLHVGLAAALVRLERMPEAIAQYESAMRLGLLAAEEQLRFGRALAEVGRVDDALAHLQEAVRLNPKDAGTHVVLGMVLSAAGRGAEALRHFFAAVQLAPDDAAAHAALGDALVDAYRPSEAVPHYETALRLQPEQAAILHTSLGNALSRLGRAFEAIRHYEEALRLNPNDAEAQANLARIRAAAQRRGLLKK
ncbi:MAG: tetratricopeptide repeat protein [Verrucomicrobia bacterium]|nr:tetratricopeptide repeat protein [Verrucomicrobiota bacterium]